MKAYDCSKILDYRHERDRLCHAVGDCLVCPMCDIDCQNLNAIGTTEIDVLQHWSDANPEKTRLEKFMEFIEGTEFEDGFREIPYRNGSNPSSYLVMKENDWWQKV